MNGEPALTWEFWLPILVLSSSLVTGIVIFFLGEEQHNLRSFLNVFGASVKMVLIGFMVWGVAVGIRYEARFPLVGEFDLVLRVDPIALLFVGLSATLWLLTTIYAIGYLEGSPNRSRFFGFFSLCVTATMGIALAGNPITFLIFYELLTITTYPLVVHRGTASAIAAGRTYLVYTLLGGTVLLVAVVWLHTVAGRVDFVPGGALEVLAQEHPIELAVIFVLMVGSLGVKAAIVPLHGWLPVAMVAPAPVSALLHAVAVVKAGAYGIVRVVHDLFGIATVEEFGLLTPLVIAASLTIVYGSLQALAQDELKRRLAFSTVSQLSYIALGAAIVGPLALTGALVHLVHQGIMKITLFFCAGNIAETLHIHRVSEMNGVGRRMPLTMGAFTIAALGMIGLPPMAGFVSKWYLGLGALEGGQPWVIVILAISSFLNAAYFLPAIHAAWFKAPAEPWPAVEGRRLEAGWMLVVPAVSTAVLALLMGLLAQMPFGPLDLADRVIRGMP